MEKTLGIRREDKNPWERRAPFIPEDVKQLTQQFPVGFEVQPSLIRIFSNDEYSAPRVSINEHLSSSSTIFAIKEIPLHVYEPHKTYVFFSHTAKGQAHNIPLLKKMMDLHCTLIDYEKIVDEKGRRLIAFGRFAGIVGMVESLWALGQRLSWEHITTPFTQVPHAYLAENLQTLKETITRVGMIIREKGLPLSLPPVICGITGYGNASRGAQEILDLLPITQITPQEISSTYDNPSPHCIYKVVFKEEDMVMPRSPHTPFNLQHYYSHPEDYQSQFEQYIPHLTLLINCIYWGPQYPRVVTKKYITSLFQKEAHPRLRVIGDISCDLKGSIEFTEKTMKPDNPVFTYNPKDDTLTDGYHGEGVTVMAVDNLPCELPRESSTEFSNVLKALVPGFLQADFSQDFHHCNLPPPLKKAVILYKGELTPSYHYLANVIGGTI